MQKKKTTVNTFLKKKYPYLNLKRLQHFNKQIHYKTKQGRIAEDGHLLYSKYNQLVRQKITFLKSQNNRNYLFFLKNTKNNHIQTLTNNYSTLKLFTVCLNLTPHSFFCKPNVYNIFTNKNINKHSPLLLLTPSLPTTHITFTKYVMSGTGYR